jgi:integrase/recombinase XerD
MTPLRQRFVDDMHLQGLSAPTQKSYLLNVVLLSRYFNKSPEDLCTEDLRSYLVYLRKEKKIAPSTFGQNIASIKFIWTKTLSRQWELSSSVKNKRPLKLPVVLSIEEVNKLLQFIYDANCVFRFIWHSNPVLSGTCFRSEATHVFKLLKVPEQC